MNVLESRFGIIKIIKVKAEERKQNCSSWLSHPGCRKACKFQDSSGRRGVVGSVEALIEKQGLSDWRKITFQGDRQAPSHKGRNKHAMCGD